MVYELESNGAELALSMSDIPVSDGVWWARAGVRGAASERLSASGSSKRAALDAVADAWIVVQGSPGYPLLDWPAISSALAAVRAV